jgi:protein TonB
LLTPVLRGRDFPGGMLDAWPRGAQVFMRFRIDASGRIIQCFVDRGTGNPAIDAELCRLTQFRFRYRPAYNRFGQAVAGWAGYRQTPPR